MNSTQKVASIVDDKGNEIAQFLAAPNALSEDADVVSQGLYFLCETIIRGVLPEERGGGLGGEFGYGVPFENDVFVMRRFYWGDCDCGADDLCTVEHDEPHKETCSMELPNFLHKRSGLQIRWYKWIGRSMEARPETIENWAGIWRECYESLPQEARDKADAQRAHESTPEYQEAEAKAMREWMDEMDRQFNSENDDDSGGETK